jgi:bacillithiol system protein YtxJ
MGLFGLKKTAKEAFPWIELTSIEQLNELLENKEHPVLLFKHSTRCSISSMALNRFESDWDQSKTEIQTYYLDLLEQRPISAEIEKLTGVTHQSPQAILVFQGKVYYDASHSGINAQVIQSTSFN